MFDTFLFSTWRFVKWRGKWRIWTWYSDTFCLGSFPSGSAVAPALEEQPLLLVFPNNDAFCCLCHSAFLDSCTAARYSSLSSIFISAGYMYISSSLSSSLSNWVWFLPKFPRSSFLMFSSIMDFFFLAASFFCIQSIISVLTLGGTFSHFFEFLINFFFLLALQLSS